MIDSEDEMLLAAVDRLDDAAECLRRSCVPPAKVAGLVRLIADVQRGIMAMTGEPPKRKGANRFVVVNPIH